MENHKNHLNSHKTSHNQTHSKLNNNAHNKTHFNTHSNVHHNQNAHKSHKVIVIKSHLFNALAPKFFKHLFWNTIFFTFLYSIYYFINKYFDVGFEIELIFGLILLTLLFSFFKILKDLIIILNTTFSFHHSYLERKFKFFKEKTHTVSYNQITDIQIIKTIWDRICGVGDIHIHTAADEYAGKSDYALILRDVKNPEKIKHGVVKKIHEK